MTAVLRIVNRSVAIVALVAVVVALAMAALAAKNGAIGSGFGQRIDKLGLPTAAKTVGGSVSRRR